MHAPEPDRPWLRWALLAAWSLTIFATVPFVRGLQRRVAESLGSSAFGWFVVGVVLAVAAWGLARVGGRHTGPVPWARLGAVAAAYLLWTAGLWERPEEAVHLVEYGLLGLLAFRALELRLGGLSASLGATLVAALIGMVDEIIQWVTPDRVPDFRDIAINAGAAALIQVALWRSGRPAGARPRARDLRTVCRLAIAALTLLGLCLAATPPRLRRLGRVIPAAAALADNPTPICEYGHLVVEPGIGTFTSRFDATDLARLDRERAAEGASIIDRYPTSRYAEFLRAYTPGSDPWVHELRVHIFNRNRHSGLARDLADDPVARRHHATVAWREQLLVDRYWGATMARSRKHHLPPARLAELERDHDPAASFRSQAGIRIITRIDEVSLRLVVLAAVLALLGVELYLGRRLRT